MFLGLNPVNQSGAYALQQWSIWAGGPTAADPFPLLNSNVKNMALQVTPLIPTDPIFNWLPVLPTYPIIVASKNGRDIQTFSTYLGTHVGGNPAAQPGWARMIGTKAPPQGAVAARHVVMGSFGSSAKTNVRHWSTKPLPPFSLQMFVNAMEWSRGATAPPVPYIARVGVVGDYDKNGDRQIEGLLAGKGYTISSYTSGALNTLTSDINAMSIDVIVINNVGNSSAFDTMLAAADAADCGVVFLGTRDASTTGLGVLADRSGDPQSYAEENGDGAVKFKVLSSHPVLAGFSVGKNATVINGGKNDYVVYTLPGTTQYTTIADSKMKLTGGMVAVRDRSGSVTRHVLLGPLGVNKKTTIGHWTQSGKDVLVQAIEWARNGSP